MAEARIAAETRTEFGKGAARRTRRAGKIPAVLYGHGTDPQHLALPSSSSSRASCASRAATPCSRSTSAGTPAARADQDRRRAPDPALHRARRPAGHPARREGRGRGAPSSSPATPAPGTPDHPGAQHARGRGRRARPSRSSIEVSVEGLAIGTQSTRASCTLPGGVELRTDPELLVVNVVAGHRGRRGRGRPTRRRPPPRPRPRERRGGRAGGVRGSTTRTDSDAVPGPALVVGLGNPGPDYADTRHNVGFRVVDLLAARAGGGRFSAHKSNADVCEGRLAGRRVVLAKPRTYMNVSGGPVAGLVRYFSVPVEDIIVVHDDLDLGFGVVRLKRGGGEGGHNGLRSISQSVGTKDYLRVRLRHRPPARAARTRPTTCSSGSPPPSARSWTSPSTSPPTPPRPSWPTGWSRRRTASTRCPADGLFHQGKRSSVDLEQRPFALDHVNPAAAEPPRPVPRCCTASAVPVGRCRRTPRSGRPDPRRAQPAAAPPPPASPPRSALPRRAVRPRLLPCPSTVHTGRLGRSRESGSRNRRPGCHHVPPAGHWGVRAQRIAGP